VSLQQLRENKMKWIKWVTVVLIILWGLNEELESQGFCIKKMAFLSDLYTEQELIDQAIAYTIRRIPSAIGWRGEGKDIKIIPYRTVEEFKRKNPNCCTLTRKLPENEPPKEYGYVEITYLRFYENDIRPPKEYGGFIPYNSCGEITLTY